MTNWISITGLGLFLACAPLGGPEQDVLTLEVGPHMVDCMGEAPRRCLRVRIENAREWTAFFDPIADFVHEEGFRFVIEVERQSVPNPPADGSSYRYRLIRILEREPAG